MSSPAADLGFAPVPAERLSGPGVLGRVWPLLAVVVGMATIATCLLVPQVAQNRTVRAELLTLRAEHARIQAQVEANDAFLQSMTSSSDPALTARLAQRQLRILPSGTEALELQGIPEEHRSPFQMVRVPAAPQDATPVRAGPAIPAFLTDDRNRLYLLAASLMLVAAGLICDGRARRSVG